MPYVDGRTRMEYRLTDKGRDLYPVLIALRDWGDSYMAPAGLPSATATVTAQAKRMPRSPAITADTR